MQKIEDINGAEREVCPDDIKELHPINGESEVHLSSKSYCYSWVINDFSECLNVIADYRHCQLTSPVFMFEDTKWRYSLEINSQDNKVTQLSVKLLNETPINSNLYFKNKVIVTDDDGKKFQADVEFCGEIPLTPSTLLPSWNSATFTSSDKLKIRSELTSLAFKECNEAAITPDPLHTSDSLRSAKKATSVPPSLKRRYRRFVSSPFHDAVISTTLSVLIFFISSMIVFDIFHCDHKYKKDQDALPITIKSSEINQLIYDSTFKLNLIAEALNLTAIKEKSSEILAIYSDRHNSADPVKRSIDSNKPQSLPVKISSFVASKFKQFIYGLKNTTEKKL